MGQLAYIESQVHIHKDGFDVQTSVQEFMSYYKRIGWHLVGRVNALPGMAEIPTRYCQPQELTPEAITELSVQQGKLNL